MVYRHKGKLIANISDDDAHEIATWLASELPSQQPRVRIGSVPSGWLP
jgi:hypothetical protein